jgi:two-component system phosphate regulon response regulator OmpR
MRLRARERASRAVDIIDQHVQTSGGASAMTTSGSVLIVDDDASVRAMIAEYLGENGYEIGQAESGEAMRAALARKVPDVVLLDVRLGREDGLSLARYLRERYEGLGIIMVTAAGDVIDRVIGLEVGADDYIAKPFDPRELRARLRSVARRVQSRAGQSAATKSDPTVAIGRCRLDLAAHRMFDADGKEIALTSMEFDLLKMFIEHPNRALSRDQLLNSTRNRDWQPFDRSIDIRVARLRRKIEQDPEAPQLIKTVRNTGYMYIPSRS